MFGATNGGIRAILRLEGLCVLAMALWAYGTFGLGWSTFALFFLAPDLSLLGYLAGPRAGALAYNAAHAYLGAFCCLAAGILLPAGSLTAMGLIWCAHIGLDRALGYGLKYAAGFHFTHLGAIGRAAGMTRRPIRP